MALGPLHPEHITAMFDALLSQTPRRLTDGWPSLTRVHGGDTFPCPWSDAVQVFVEDVTAEGEPAQKLVEEIDALGLKNPGRILEGLT